MKNLKILGIITMAVLLVAVCAIAAMAAFGVFTIKDPEKLPQSDIVIGSSGDELSAKITAIIKTDAGDITIELADSSAGEKFIELTDAGAFSFAEFVTLSENMFIQTNLCGEGFSFDETGLLCEKGAVGFVIEDEMAHPSIVIITAEDLSADFEGKVLVFAKVISGMEVVSEIEKGENSGYTGGFSAVDPVKINSIEITYPDEAINN